MPIPCGHADRAGTPLLRSHPPVPVEPTGDVLDELPKSDKQPLRLRRVERQRLVSGRPHRENHHAGLLEEPSPSTCPKQKSSAHSQRSRSLAQ